MADTVKMDLKQDFRDEDGTLYEAGTDREIPKALADRIKQPIRGEAGAQEEENQLPAISKLADHIKGMDEAGIQSLMDADDRKSATAIYEKRLAEFGAQ